jgi:hypothetical protein
MFKTFAGFIAEYGPDEVERTRVFTEGPLRDGISINLQDLSDRMRLGKRQTREALAGLIEKGFIVNLTPELALDRAVFRLTFLPFQGEPPTNDYERKFLDRAGVDK